MTRQENNPEAKQPGRNRLGKLYPSLVNEDVLPDESLDAAQNNLTEKVDLLPSRLVTLNYIWPSD